MIRDFYLSHNADSTDLQKKFLHLSSSQAGKTTCSDALQSVCNLKVPRAKVSAFMRASVEMWLRLRGKDMEKAISIQK